LAASLLVGAKVVGDRILEHYAVRNKVLLPEFLMIDFLTKNRRKERLEDHIEMFRCYYNFIRPHRTLKFGPEVRTSAMQTGLTRRMFREIFEAGVAFLRVETCPIRAL
jgi:hypothetical protein